MLIQLSKDIRNLILHELKFLDIWNLMKSNSTFYRKYRHNDIFWRQKIKIDFPDINLPDYLNEPDWMRVYFHWNHWKNLVADFEFTNHGKYLVDQNMMPLFTSGVRYSQSMDRIIGVLIKLGAVVTEDDVVLRGYLQHRKYLFEINLSYDASAINFITDCKHASDKYMVFYDQIREYLILSFSCSYFYSHECRTFGWSEWKEMFELRAIPNRQDWGIYEYYYIPDLIIDDKMTERDYIKQKIWNCAPLLVAEKDEYQMINFKPYFRRRETIADLLIEIISDTTNPSEYIDFNNNKYEFLGNYHGTPFLLFVPISDLNLYLRCPTKTPELLINKVRSLFSEYLLGDKKSLRL